MRSCSLPGWAKRPVARGIAAALLLGAFLLRRFAGLSPCFPQSRENFRCAVLVGAWWLGDAAGILLVAPFLLAGRRSREVGAPLRALSLLASLFALGIGPPGARTGYPHLPMYPKAQTADPMVRANLGESLLLPETLMGMAVLTVLALSAALTERRRAEEEIHWRKREMATLNVLIPAVRGSRELPEVLAAVKQQLRERLALPRGAILLREAAGGGLRLEESWGLPEEMLGSRHPLLDSLLQERKPLFASRSVLGTNACVIVPLLTDGHGPIQGVLLLFGPTSPPFREEDLPFFETLGWQVGGALGDVGLYEEVRAAREQIQSLSRRLVAVQEEERTRIAQELHDQIGQMLTGLKLALEISQRVSPEAGGAKLEAANELVRDLIARVRGISLDLRPSMLDDFGLLPALTWLIQRYTVQTSVRVAFEHRELDGRRFPSLVETAAFRSVQEALTNVARYAGVPEAHVRLWVEEGRLFVRIEDRGAGFDADAVRAAGGTSGLAGMRERARLLGGRVYVVSAPGAGTAVTVELPLDAEDEENKAG